MTPPTTSAGLPDTDELELREQQNASLRAAMDAISGHIAKIDHILKQGVLHAPPEPAGGTVAAASDLDRIAQLLIANEWPTAAARSADFSAWTRSLSMWRRGGTMTPCEMRWLADALSQSPKRAEAERRS